MLDPLINTKSLSSPIKMSKGRAVVTEHMIFAMIGFASVVVLGKKNTEVDDVRKRIKER